MLALACPALAWATERGAALNDPASGPTEPLCIVGPDHRVHRFEVEIAADEPARRRGLMFRRAMADDHGMLFWFEAERRVGMWMKNTYISLDMVFIDRLGRVVSVAERTEPHSEKIIQSGPPASAVLEVNAGVAGSRGIEPGAEVLHRYFGRSCP